MPDRFCLSEFAESYFSERRRLSPQTEAEDGWGDYSDLTVDPSDDCTFWYTQEYLGQDVLVIGTWRTRIVSFKFPGCKK